MPQKIISIVIPVFNEESNLPLLYRELLETLKLLKKRYGYELIFVDDGSADKSPAVLEKIAARDKNVRYIQFSRNFGKEIATTAGINNCKGDACIMVDADLQHPVEIIPEFVKKWEAGFEVVIGVRKANKSEGFLKKFGSFLFYKIINRISEVKIVPSATDFRLIDRKVIDEFNRFTETNRMTRALIDWLGFRRSYIHFDARKRANGTASYTFSMLFRLAMKSFVSLSLLPLTLAGYLGVTITLVSGVSGLYIMLGKYFFHTPFASTFSDAENLAIMIVFLVGIILISIGLLAVYVANIHREVVNRPMYAVRKTNLKIKI
jgi:dolichol-phosphate mannosyltransferase